ncbi:DMT family transporter [Subtercola frigoramans]|uniref:Drug/metabolite transporter (DMT)-like permease n=1 Tax=Subtercola frigoramans TaxID=120298 RepID=A0ABS2L8Y5_9MICO|nr:DMT family transporter [Subtercola frigoramans]MBM7473542.1 drug/metabolite transporter (DMT)-like permease [Subtercola frigoramans]
MTETAPPAPGPSPQLAAGKPRRGASVLVQFIAMGLVWGGSFLFMKVALTGVGFGQVAWARLVFGAVTLGLIVLIGRYRLPREPVVWLHFFVIGTVGSAIPFLLFAWAEQYVSSSLASIYNAVTPITTALMATLAFRVERLNRGQVLGVIIGIIGTVVIIGPWGYATLSGDLVGQLACLGAALCYGFSLSYTRRFLSGRSIAGVPFAFMQVGMGALVLLALTPVVALSPVILSVPIVLSLVALGALGTGLVYVWNINVLRAWGPTSASTVTYITPVVGVILGILVLSETFTVNEPIGAALVLLGILLTQKRIRLWAGPNARLG